MDTGITEQDARLLARELFEAERKIRRQMNTIRELRSEVNEYDSLAADRARLEKAISEINDLATGASDRDIQARIRAIKEVTRTA